MTDLSAVKRPSSWHKVRGEIKATVADILGRLPEAHIEPQVKHGTEETFLSYNRKEITYFVDDWTRASAWLFVPDNPEPVPAILCCHDRVPQGMNEPAGLGGSPNLAFARHYAEMGYVALAPNAITAGARTGVNLEPFDTTNFYKDYPEMSALGKMMWDYSQGIEVLQEIKNVDTERIGVIGHGLGGTVSLLLSAFDERVHACVASCAFTRFADDDHPERWIEDEKFEALPSLRQAVNDKSFPFDWEHVLALAAPAPILLLTALNDSQLPKTKSCEKAAKAARRVYKMLGEEDALACHLHEEGRTVTPELMELADDWFERWL